MTAADLPMIERWLALPHVREWWGDPAEQYTLVSGDLDEPAMDQFIVSVDGSDFAYIQCYDLTAWNSGFGEQPKGTRGIDQFIGEPDMLGTRSRIGVHPRLRRRPAGARRASNRDRPRSGKSARHSRLRESGL